MSDIDATRSLAARRLMILYWVRAVFAVLWVTLLLVAPTQGTALRGPGIAIAALLVIYPLSDIVATFFDIRATPTVGWRTQYLNIAFGLAATVGIAIGISISWTAISIVFGLWAIGAGAAMLVIATFRRRLVGGQIMMILSAIGSIFGGLGFVSYATPSATGATLAQYSIGGAFFYVLGAFLLTETAGRVRRTVVEAIRNPGG